MENLTLESRLLAVVLMFTLLVAVSLLITFYTEIAGKPTEKNMVTGVLLGFWIKQFFFFVIFIIFNNCYDFNEINQIFISVIACSSTFTTSNALQKFGHHSCAPWQFLVYRGSFQIISMMLFRCWSFIEYFKDQVSTLIWWKLAYYYGIFRNSKEDIFSIEFVFFVTDHTSS